MTHPQTARESRWGRWAVPVVLVIGAWSLSWNVASTGLWEPWEMDRAALARTLVDPGEVSIGLGLDSGAELRATVEGAAEAAAVVPRFAAPPVKGARGAAAGPRTIREALDRAREDVLAAVVLDLGLLGATTSADITWDTAWENLDEAASYVPNGRVILLDAAGEGDAAVRRALAAARVRTTWASMQRDWDLDAEVIWPPTADPFWDQLLADAPGPVPGLRVVPVADTAALTEALVEADEAMRTVVQFKDHGQTMTVPPLRHQLTAALYRAFGISEATTRLAGTSLAWLALLCFTLFVRRRFGPTAALIAGLVLATTPLFYLQARSAAGQDHGDADAKG